MTVIDEHGNVALCDCGEPAIAWGTAPEYKGQWWCEEHTPWEMPGRAEKRENKRLREEVDHLRAREAALVDEVRAVAEANVICNHYFDILDGYPHPPEHVDYLCPTAGHPKASTVRAQARALLASDSGDEAQ